MTKELNSYSLSRNWFDFAFDNPEKIKPNHTALYFFMIEHCNRLGWKRKFGLPTTMAKEAIGIRSYNTYIDTFNDLISFGFVDLIEKSTNQYSANIIALSNFDKASSRALDKAFIKHDTKQVVKQRESISSIDKQENKEQENKEQEKSNNELVKIEFLNCSEQYFTDKARILKVSVATIKKEAEEFWLDNYQDSADKLSFNDVRRHFGNWAKKQDIKDISDIRRRIPIN